MLKMLIPLLLLVIGTGAGIGGGLYLRPAPPADENAAGPGAEAPAPATEPEPAPRPAKYDSTAPGRDYIKLNNQFIVPLIEGERVVSLVVLTLGVEVPTGQKERLYLMEPKVRDVFLQELFAHANRGGFRGAFTSARNLDDLRSSLREAARYALGDLISDILIVDILRQDN